MRIRPDYSCIGLAQGRMEEKNIDSVQIAYPSDEYRVKLRVHWAACMVVALTAEDAREEQAQRDEEE